MRPAGRRKRGMRKFAGERSAGVELDPRPSDDVDDPLVSPPPQTGVLKLSEEQDSCQCEVKQVLTTLTELAKMEEGNRIRIAGIDDSYDMHFEDALCHDELSDCYAVQQLLYGSYCVYRYSVHHRCDFFDREYDVVADHRQENYLCCVRLLDVSWCVVEYARFHDL
jgi:hypothetical protein